MCVGACVRMCVGVRGRLPIFQYSMPNCSKTVPVDTNDRQQRNSRIVPRYDDDNLWDAVRDGVIVSSDLDDRMRPKTPLPPFQRQERPFSSPNVPILDPPPPVPPPKPPPKPLGEITNVTPDETEVEMLKKHLKLQASVINGLCRLRAFEAENASHLDTRR